MNGVGDDTPYAPTRVVAAKRATEPALRPRGRQRIVDEHAKIGFAAATCDLKSHAIWADDEKPGRANGLPDLSMGRDAFDHDLVQRKLEAEHATAHSDVRPHTLTAARIQLGPHATPSHSPRRLAHVRDEAFVVVDAREHLLGRRGYQCPALAMMREAACCTSVHETGLGSDCMTRSRVLLPSGNVAASPSRAMC